MSSPVVTGSCPPAPQIWVKRYVWQWVTASTCEETETPAMVPQAVCTWGLADKMLPAVKDWPRWKTDNASQLPVDEYWRVTFTSQVAGPSTTECGPLVTWNPIWTKIETPKAWRWVSSEDDQVCA